MPRIRIPFRPFFGAAMLVAAFSNSSLASETNSFGFGVVIGDPIGLSVVQNIEGSHAIQAAIGWDWGDWVVMQADLLWKERRLFPEEVRSNLSLNYGAGGRVTIGQRPRNVVVGPYRRTQGGMGIRFPVQLQYYVPHTPVDVFLEWTPLLNLFPDTNVDLGWAVGFRLNI